MASFLGSLGLAGAAESACVGSQQINSCNTVCTANCWLNGNINCTDGQGITLNSGFDLDMCGNHLTCTSATCLTKPAVTMGGTSSKVFNSQSNEGVIGGIFLTGVQCASKSGSQVVGIRIDGSNTATDGCAKVQNNVINSNNGVYSYGVANTDDISGNYIEFGSVGISYNGNKDISIEDNVLVSTVGTGIGIDDHSSSASETVSGNVIYGDGTPIYGNGGGGGPVYSRNTCDPQYSSCSSCRSSGFCLSPTAPFAY